MPSLRSLIFTFLLSLSFSALSFAQAAESTLLKLDSTETADTSRAVIKVLLREIETSELVMGATVLLRRESDKMYGRVSEADGRCFFKVGAGSYTVRVQMTGLASFEQSGFLLEKGKSYTMEIAMARR